MKRCLFQAKMVVGHMTSAPFGWPVGMLQHRKLGYILAKINPLDLHKIKGPHSYPKFYHTSSEGLVCLDGKGNPILLSHMLGAHV